MMLLRDRIGKGNCEDSLHLLNKALRAPLTHSFETQDDYQHAAATTEAFLCRARKNSFKSKMN
jgi:hypothetical protein